MRPLIKIKFCGIRRPEDVAELNRLVPDYAGFVFAKSRRQVSAEEAAELAGRMDEKIIRVGVFVRQAPEYIAELLNKGIIQRAQLHGEEDPEYCLYLKKKICNPESRKLILARKVISEEEIAAAEQIQEELLLDSGTASEGGSGIISDWSAAKKVRRPFFLAGGLTPENIEDAVRQVHPWAVDVSSGVETDGCKDPEKMRRFVRELRRAEMQLHEQEEKAEAAHNKGGR